MHFCALLSVMALRHYMASNLRIDGNSSFVRLSDFVHRILLLLCKGKISCGIKTFVSTSF